MLEHVELDLKIKVSKYMSYLLRHNPENLKMDGHGFVFLDGLLEKLDERFQVNEKLISEIVEKSDRRRLARARAWSHDTCKIETGGG